MRSPGQGKDRSLSASPSHPSVLPGFHDFGVLSCFTVSRCYMYTCLKIYSEVPGDLGWLG